MYIDGALVIDGWADNPVREVIGERYLLNGNHELVVDYYERVGDAQIAVWWDQATDYSEWRGEYFSASDLSGTAVWIRNDHILDFDWGTSRPGVGIAADNFSVRWTRSVPFETAVYRFHLTVDDGARAWIDNHLFMDNWRDGPVRELTTDYATIQGGHSLRIEYYEHTGSARVRFWWEKLPAPTISAWKGEYWTNRLFEGSPVAIRNDQTIDFDFGIYGPIAGMPNDNFSIRWTRDYNFDPGIYRFYARADDGIRFYAGGTLSIDRWSDSAGTDVHSVDLPLSGQSSLVVEYYDRTGNANIKFWWERVATPTPTVTATPTVTLTTTPTSTATGTSTATPTRTTSATQTPTLTATATSTSSATPTATATSTETATPTATLTASLTLTATATVTTTATVTLTPSLTTTGTITTAFVAPAVPIAVRLNEVMALPQSLDSNKNPAAINKGSWIELYNAGTTPQDISGWMLASRGSKGQVYRLPANSVLAPGQYMVVYPSGDGIVLQDNNELILLFDRTARLVDAVEIFATRSDASYSRGVHGEWHADSRASPGEPNPPPAKVAP